MLLDMIIKFIVKAVLYASLLFSVVCNSLIFFFLSDWTFHITFLILEIQPVKDTNT